MSSSQNERGKNERIKFQCFSVVGMCTGMNTKQIIDSLQRFCRVCDCMFLLCSKKPETYIYIYIIFQNLSNAGFHGTEVFEYVRLDADHNGEAIFEYCPHSESQTVSRQKRDSLESHDTIIHRFKFSSCKEM